MTDVILTVENVSKNFGGVAALRNVSLTVRKGEIHALVGENGAGKTTLMNILEGSIRPDSGSIVFKGEKREFRDIAESNAAGISVIHQELAVFGHMTILENLLMKELADKKGLFLDWRGLEDKARRILSMINLDIDPFRRMDSLSVSDQQQIEIARSLHRASDLIIMDEPNSSLSEKETRKMFALVRDLAAQGVSFVYISHKLDEVLKLVDRVTVFRDGTFIDEVENKDLGEEQVAKMMVGRDLDKTVVSTIKESGEALLQVDSLSGRVFSDISFDLRKGEVLGVYGLVGAGRSELAAALFGSVPATSGQVRLMGKPVVINDVATAIQMGLAMLPEDRKIMSLFMNLAVQTNMTITKLPSLRGKAKLVDPQKETGISSRFVDLLNIKTANLSTPVKNLSGGNQQKVALARWLMLEPKLLILDEPTHGIDIGAKVEIYHLIRRLADRGMGVILISSEMPEILRLSDRIAVMCRGEITGILDRTEATEENLVYHATGIRRGSTSQVL